MIELRNLRKEYITKSETVIAIRELNCVLPSRGMIFVLGRSGSGKSTLLNLIGGIDWPSSGTISIDGIKIDQFNSSELNQYRCNDVGFVFQGYNLLSNFTVFKNINLALPHSSSVSARKDILKSLSDVDLSGFENRYPNELSGGEQQRVAIARAIVKEPKIILADEPTGNLDDKTGNQIFEILRTLSKKSLVIVATHDEAACTKYADRIIKIKNGELAEDICLHEEPEIETQRTQINQVESHSEYRKTLFRLSVFYLKNHIAKAFITLLLFILSLSAFTCMLSMSLYNTEKGIALTVQTNDSQYLYFYETEIGRYGIRDKTHNYINRTIINDFYQQDIYKVIASRDYFIGSLNGDGIYYNEAYGIVTSMEELADFGLEFIEPSYSLSNDTVITSDLTVDYMKYVTSEFYRTGETQEFIYYVDIGNNEVRLDDLDNSDIVGKRIIQYSAYRLSDELQYESSFIISAIYLTNYREFYNDDFSINESLNEDTIRNWIFLWEHIYVTYITQEYRNVHNYVPGYNEYNISMSPYYLNKSIYEERDYTLEVIYDQNKVSPNVSDLDSVYIFEGDGYKIIGESGFLDIDNLDSSEVYIDLNFYNTINDTDYTYSDLIDGDNLVINLENIGDTLEIKVTDDNLESVKINDEYVIAGVIASNLDTGDDDDPRMFVYMTNSKYDVFLNTYYETYSNVSVYIGDNYDNLYNVLKECAKKNIYPDFDYSYSFYSLDTGVRQSQALMTILSSVLLLITFIMISNLISSSVISKKKEIGILESLGYTTKRISIIFIFQALIIGTITLVLSVILQPIIISILNQVIAKSEFEHIQFFSVEVSTILMIVGITVVLPLMSIIFPIYTITHMSPTECINRS